MRAVLVTLGLAAAVAAGASARADGPTRVKIVVWPEGRDAASVTWTLRCRPAGGTHPRPARACRALFRRRAALRPVPPGRACTAVYGGPQVARVTGVVEGLRVRARFNRQNGCEIFRWDRLAILFRSG